MASRPPTGIRVRHARPGPLVAPPSGVVGTPQPPRVLPVASSSPVTRTFISGAGARDVVLTVPAYRGWRLAGYATGTQFGVTVALTRTSPVASGPLVARYGPYGVVEMWDVVGAVLVVADLGLIVVFARRSRRRRAPFGAHGWPPSPPNSGP